MPLRGTNGVRRRWLCVARSSSEVQQAPPCAEGPAANGLKDTDPGKSQISEATMRLPPANAPRRPPPGSTAYIILIVLTFVVAGIIVIVTGSTSGFTDLTSVLMVAGALGDRHHTQRKQ